MSSIKKDSDHITRKEVDVMIIQINRVLGLMDERFHKIENEIKEIKKKLEK